MLVLLSACSREAPKPPATAESPKPHAISGLPIELALKQRTTSPVPGSDGRVSISLEDITRDQVMVSVVRTPAPDGSSALLGPLSMKAQDASTFHFDGSDFVLTLNALDNALVGDDVAKFALRAADAKPPKLTEAQKIERLIDAVAKLEGATFLRNGDEHSTADAVEHLRRKLVAGGDDIATAEQFIEHAATRSSFTGQDYQVRLADGRVVRLADFLRERLAEIKSV
ncbi:MAG: DUF5329 family protein [Planctomycetes bacterium]|nr:DUF5329 family protein [Planctomycetota bacterium]MCC7173289.1 DUF5329 family protein [Planctomycetota bacterium]